MRQVVERRGQMELAWQAWRERLRRFLVGKVADAEIDDILQETLLRIWKGISQLREEERLDAWIYKVARSVMMDRWRRDARRRGHEESFGREMQSLQEDRVEVDIEETGWSPQDLLALSVPEFIEALPETYREILKLTEIEGLTQQEAATRLGLSLSGAKSRVQRGRRLLRESFEACCALAFDSRGRVVECMPRGWGENDCRCGDEDRVV
ncbi:MAG: sigma-70 family RNA polymerase sigma factor [Myxococcales bacterium]|nr:sigma-70 family RNA polymerase sigma factor [Myxococcales bacterium]MCB9641520.1 sigma-70 family RNA polymerase sigma factor [Myxococcales bacterium]